MNMDNVEKMLKHDKLFQNVLLSVNYDEEMKQKLLKNKENQPPKNISENKEINKEITSIISNDNQNNANFDNMSISSSQYSGSLLYHLKSDKLGIPNKLIIDGYHYSFKDQLKNNRFSYRCKRRGCGVLLNIEKNELDKIKYGGSTNINYYINKEHTCIPQNMTAEEQDNALNEKDIYIKGKASILMNPEKPLNFHIKNIKDLKLKMNFDQIKKVIQFEREKKYPYDSQFLSNLNEIKIYFDSKSIINENGETINVPICVPFCHTISKILNQEKNYREEKFIIFTSFPQLSNFVESNEIYIDNNYKAIPRGYKFIMSIMSFNSKTNKYIPVFIIPISHKSKVVYSYVFKAIIQIINDNKLSFDFNNKKIFCEFDYSMREALKELYPNSKLSSTYFHYIKKLWIKAKKFGLIHQKFIENKKIVIFALESIVFIKKENIYNYFEDIKKYIKDVPNVIYSNFENYLKYFEKTFLYSNYILFDSINGEEWLSRSNNVLEIYHNKLTYSIEYFYPKMAALVEKLKNIVTEYYSNVKLIETVPDNILNKNTFDEIYNFILSYNKNNKHGIKIKDLEKLEGELKKNFDQINFDCMKCFFGLQCMNIEDENDYSKNEYNYNELEQIICPKGNGEDIINKMDTEKKMNILFEEYQNNKTDEPSNKFNELYNFS